MFNTHCLLKVVHVYLALFVQSLQLWSMIIIVPTILKWIRKICSKYPAQVSSCVVCIVVTYVIRSGESPEGTGTEVMLWVTEMCDTVYYIFVWESQKNSLL